MCACKSCPSAERPDLTVTLLVHNGKDPPEPVLIIARPLRNTEAPNLRIAIFFLLQVKQRQPLFWSCCSNNDNISIFILGEHINFGPATCMIRRKGSRRARGLQSRQEAGFRPSVLPL